MQTVGLVIYNLCEECSTQFRTSVSQRLNTQHRRVEEASVYGGRGHNSAAVTGNAGQLFKKFQQMSMLEISVQL